LGIVHVSNHKASRLVGARKSRILQIKVPGWGLPKALQWQERRAVVFTTGRAHFGAFRDISAEGREVKKPRKNCGFLAFSGVGRKT
jgi:hypothetical protein